MGWKFFGLQARAACQVVRAAAEPRVGWRRGAVDEGWRRGSGGAEEFDLAADFVAGGGSGLGEGGVFAGAFEDEELTTEETESTEVRRRRPPYDDVNGHERHEKHESCDVKNVAARRNWRSSHRKGRRRIGFGMVARERHFWEC